MGTYFRQLRALKNLRQLDLQLKTVWTPAVGKGSRRSYDNLHTPQPLVRKSECWHRRLSPTRLSEEKSAGTGARESITRDAKARRKLALEQEGKRSAHLVIAQATLVSQAVRNSKKR